MRIIAGEFRGRPLTAPKGTMTRPTTDRVRESLMSTLASARGGFEGAVVLDAFAGSGALGLEALSRGARSVQFCEKDSGALRALKGNVAALKLDADRVEIRKADVLQHIPYAQNGCFDLVFLDPPYAVECDAVFRFLERLKAAGSLAAGALICYEHAKKCDSAVTDALDSLQWGLVSAKIYGDTAIHIFHCGMVEGAPAGNDMD